MHGDEFPKPFLRYLLYYSQTWNVAWKMFFIMGNLYKKDSLLDLRENIKASRKGREEKMFSLCRFPAGSIPLHPRQRRRRFHGRFNWNMDEKSDASFDGRGGRLGCLESPQLSASPGWVSKNQTSCRLMSSLFMDGHQPGGEGKNALSFDLSSPILSLRAKGPVSNVIIETSILSFLINSK